MVTTASVTLLMDEVGLLLQELEQSPGVGPTQLRRLKGRVARITGGPILRNDQLLERYRAEVARGTRPRNEDLERALTLNFIRSNSGIAAVSVITKPYPCPGRCVYCPTEARVPKSYLPTEPPVMRAIASNYDPYRQVLTRLQALHNTGHPTDKIELIVKGGTWSFYPPEYQREFIQGCFDAANGESSDALEQAQRRNETARHRIIGLTIETRPDFVTPAEIGRLRELGVTRVELGVQILDDRILALTLRDHTAREVAHATQLLRDAGFKIAYHLMPNLPGATPEDDLNTVRTLFDDPAYRPDALKIYPCVVLESAALYSWWLAGRYQPYDEETLIELMIQIKKQVPPYVRIERVVRDISSDWVKAGCRVNNLRQEISRRMRQRGLRCLCIRCREVADQAAGEFVLIRRDYETTGGREIFLSFEEPGGGRLAALLRLRIPSRPVLDGAAMVRELHTYGRHLSIHSRSAGAAQHQGFGRRLMAEAERIGEQEFGLRRIAVIAGVGVREYYRRLGYELEETYMVKESLPQPSLAPGD